MNSLTRRDEHWMNLAILEAKKGQGLTSPNPAVGAVIVKRDRMLAKGYHRRAGLPHAEIDAFKKIKSAKGATLYVTLEPCCHLDKRTPPCVDAILLAKVARVVIGAKDPNPKVAGKGIRVLRRAGVEVRAGLLKKECEELNLAYHHWIRKKRPYVILKVASSLDGRVALNNGKSQWITGEKSRAHAHRFRSQVDAILVGVGTVLEDNPRLTARGRGAKRQPLRVVLDPKLRIPEGANILKGEGECWVVTQPKKIKHAKASRLEKKGVRVVPVSYQKSRGFHLKKLMGILGKENILSLLVEGGPRTWSQFYRQNLMQELQWYLAPKVLGGDAQASFDFFRLKSIPNHPSWSLKAQEALGNDVYLCFRSPLD